MSNKTTTDLSTVWPSQIVAAHKVKKNKIFRVDFTKSNDYGDKFTIRSWKKYVDVSPKKGEEEWHPLCIEVLNAPSNGWMQSSKFQDKNNGDKKKGKKSKKGDDGDDWSPQIPYARSSTFTRPGPDGDIEEPLGEAAWIAAKAFHKIIEEDLEKCMGSKKLSKRYIGKMEAMPAFRTHRKYNSKTDGEDVETETIDKQLMVRMEEPTFKVKVAYNKKTMELTTVVKDLTKAKKKKGNMIIPEARLDGDTLNKNNVGDFVSKGSLCSFTLAFDTIKSHNFGVSQPFEIGWRKLSEDEKAKRVVFVKRSSSGGMKTKMSKNDQFDAMLGADVPEGSEDSSEERANRKAKAKRQAQKDMDDSGSGSDSESSSSNKKNKKKQDSDSEDSEDSTEDADIEDKLNEIDSDDSDSGSDSDQRPKKGSKKKNRDDNSDGSGSDDNSDDSESSGRKKKNSKKNKKKQESDDDNSDDSESSGRKKKSSKDKKKNSKNSKKNKKKQESDSEDSSSESD